MRAPTLVAAIYSALLTVSCATPIPPETAPPRFALRFRREGGPARFSEHTRALWISEEQNGHGAPMGMLYT